MMMMTTKCTMNSEHIRQTGCGGMTSLFVVYHASRSAYKKCVRKNVERKYCVRLWECLGVHEPCLSMCCASRRRAFLFQVGTMIVRFFIVSKGHNKIRDAQCGNTHVISLYGSFNKRNVECTRLNTLFSKERLWQTIQRSSSSQTIHNSSNSTITLVEKPTHDTPMRWLSGCRYKPHQHNLGHATNHIRMGYFPFEVRTFFVYSFSSVVPIR